MAHFKEPKAQKNHMVSVVLKVFLGLLLYPAGCERMDRANFRIVGNNTNSPDPIVIYIAGQEQKMTLALGVPVQYIVELPVPRSTRNNSTGPVEYAQQCFPISGSVRGKNLASESESQCAREDQIVQVDFQIVRGILQISSRTR